jgi:cilia- and flagella-associated protein 251
VSIIMATSQPAAATTAVAADESKQIVKLEEQALSLAWSAGFNILPNSMVNLSKVGTRVIAYASAHTLVIHDIQQRTQRLFHGHRNAISAICTMLDRSVIVSADAGEDAMLAVWEVATGEPIQVYAELPGNGVLAMDVTRDGQYIVTLSNSVPQYVQVWETNSQRDGPAATYVLTEDIELQQCVSFNPENPSEIVTNGASVAMFFNWSGGDSLTYYIPEHTAASLFSGSVHLTRSCFLPGTTKAITGTTSGDVVLWDIPGAEIGSNQRDATKRINVSDKPAEVTFIDTFFKYVVVGTSSGAVRFFDFQFRIIGWFEDLNAGAILSLSFANEFEEPTAASANATLANFSVPRFVVATHLGHAVECDCQWMNDASIERRRGIELLSTPAGDVTAISSHPTEDVFAIGTSIGTVQIWSSTDRCELQRWNFNVPISSIQYNNAGDLLAVGLENGTLSLIECGRTMRIKAVLNEAATAKNSILARDRHNKEKVYKYVLELNAEIEVNNSAPIHIAFISVKRIKTHYMAVAFSDYSVALFSYNEDDIKRKQSKKANVEKWTYIGRYVSHTAPIVGLQFVHVSDKPVPLLYSVGQDGILHKYSVADSSVASGIVITESSCVADGACPTAFVTTDKGVLHDMDDDSVKTHVTAAPASMVVVANSNHKMYAWETVAHASASASDANATATAAAAAAAAASGSTSAIASVSGTNASAEAAAAKHKHEHTSAGDNDEDEEENSGFQAKRWPCRRVIAMPTSQESITQLVPIEKDDGKQTSVGHLAFATDERLIGLLKLPLRGNPDSSMAVIAHPSRMTGIITSHNGDVIVSAGAIDRTIKFWDVHTQVLDATSAVATSSLNSYVSLLDGGRDGEMFQHLHDFFDYCQLRSQGLDSTQPRQLTNSLPVEEVPNMFRALGFFCSQQQIDDLLYEMRMRTFELDGTMCTHVSFEDVIQLYVNHRPANQLCKGEFDDAFSVLHNAMETNHPLTPDQLLHVLTTYGEQMSQAELEHCLSALQTQLPSKVTSNSFTGRVLGLHSQ